MDYNPRVIELADLAGAVGRMEDFDGSLAAKVRDLAGGRRRAMRLDTVERDTLAALRREAESIGLAVLAGPVGGRDRAPCLVIADDEGLNRLASAMEAAGEPVLAASVRNTLKAYHRTGFVLGFADGSRLEFGSRTRVMGILNVTPDSFSDGGSYPTPEDAMRAAARMAEDGADMVDVGGESTRPGADPVPEDEEIRRVVPLVRAIKAELGVRVSVDTTKASVARRALEAGADLINDVSALSDPAMLSVLREFRAPVALMHMRGTPRTMQTDTHYSDLMSSIVGFLRRAVEKALASGLSDDKLLVDPGIGFGKSPAGNLQILKELPTLRSVGRPILVGASRKSFIGVVLDLPIGERLEGSLAVAALAVWQGAHVVRAHDVAATVRVTRMTDAIRNL